MVEGCRNSKGKENRKSFLLLYIVNQRNKEKKEQSLGVEGVQSSQSIDAKAKGSCNEFVDFTANSDNNLSGNYDQSDKSQDQDKQSPGELSKQIETLQLRLEHLREKKHTLFQQLKAVLHEEDEKKRLQEEGHKQILESTMMMSQVDPRLSQGGPQCPPAKKLNRGPLLPTPDSAESAATTGAYSKHGASVGYHHGSYISSSRLQQYDSHALHTPSQRYVHDQRFGPANQIVQEMHTQGNQSRECHVLPIAQPQNVLPGMTFSHPHELQPPYLSQGVQMVNYQYQNAPMPFGSVPTAPNLASQMTYQQVAQQEYVPTHPHELVQGQPQMSMFNQPHRQATQPDSKWQAHAHYNNMSQENQASVGASPSDIPVTTSVWERPKP